MITIREFQNTDFPLVKDIYQQGIDTGNATFQNQAAIWEEWNKSHLGPCRLVAEKNGELVGWAALSPVSTRCVYAGVAEVSVYILTSHQGQGFGNKLLEELVQTSEKENIWTLQAGIFPENKASIAIHEKNGFRIVGIRKKIGEMNGVWRDVVLMERRSEVAGI